MGIVASGDYIKTPEHHIQYGLFRSYLLFVVDSAALH